MGGQQGCSLNEGGGGDGFQPVHCSIHPWEDCVRMVDTSQKIAVSKA
jgi:hypothetical protein